MCIILLLLLILIVVLLFQQKLAHAYNEKNRKNNAIIIKWKYSLFFMVKVRFWEKNEFLKPEFIMQESKKCYCFSDALAGA